MRFISYERQGVRGMGIYDGQNIVSLSEGSLAVAPDMQHFLEMGDSALQVARDALSNPAATRFAADSVAILAPLPRPVNNVLCVGRNYRDHVKETDASNPVPEHPIIFSKRPFSVIASGEDVDLHADVTQCVDYEGEVAIVIGKAARNVSESEAMDVVFGYTIVNDVSARDVQKRHTQWVIGKGMDTFCPMGPCITHTSALPDPADISLRTEVNGELRQSGNTRDLMFSIPYLVALMSRSMTLEPGDVIATGTPSGVGAGFTPPRFLRPGDTVAVTVPGIGTLTNTFR